MKSKCVLGDLKTAEGLKIKEEMLGWLNEKYDVTLVEVDPPNELYEFPFIKKAAELAITSNEPVLYIHTKGAAMQNNAQPMVREFWKYEFTENIDKYFDMPEKATVIAPYTLHKKIAWFNAFTINPKAAKRLIAYLKPQQDRYWFEQKIWNETDAIDVIGIHDSIVEWEDPWQAFLQLFSLMLINKRNM